MYSKRYEVDPSLVINMICMCHNIKLLINGLAKESGWIKNPNHLAFDITNVEQLQVLSRDFFNMIRACQKTSAAPMPAIDPNI